MVNFAVLQYKNTQAPEATGGFYYSSPLLIFTPLTDGFIQFCEGTPGVFLLFPLPILITSPGYWGGTWRLSECRCYLTRPPRSNESGSASRVARAAAFAGLRPATSGP